LRLGWYFLLIGPRIFSMEEEWWLGGRTELW